MQFCRNLSVKKKLSYHKSINKAMIKHRQTNFYRKNLMFCLMFTIRIVLSLYYVVICRIKKKLIAIHRKEKITI